MPSDALARVVAALDARGCEPKPSGTDRYESRCPAHEGGRRNLSIARGDDGRVLLHCHHEPGCPSDSVVNALGLTWADLRPEGNGHAHGNGKGQGRPPSFDSVDAAARFLAHKIGGTVAGTWMYQSADAHDHAAVVRVNTNDGGKTYRPLHRVAGGWRIGDPSGRWRLYRLPEVITADHVVVVEGEKCADALRQHGFDVTTSAHGAASPCKSDWTPLGGKNVVILPDHDEAGEGYARRLLAILKDQDPRPRVKVVRLPDLNEGEDAVEWIAQVTAPQPGDGPNSPTERVRSNLRALVMSTPSVEWDEAADAASVTPESDSVDEVTITAPEWPDPPGDAAFHGLFGEIVNLVAPTTEADPAGLLASLVVGFGNSIGPAPYFLADGSRHHTNEYAALVGKTSRGRKGTSWGRILPFLTACDPMWADSRIANGLSSGEGLIVQVKDVSDEDEVAADRRLLVQESEFGSALRILGREGNSLSGVLRDGWDGRTLRTMVKHNPLRATGAHISLLGHVTMQELARHLSTTEMHNGLANRILWCCVRRARILPHGGIVDTRAADALAGRLADAASFARGVGLVTWTAPAAERWEAVYAELTVDRPGLWGAATSRAEGHVVRLGMLYALADQSDRIDVVHLDAALALWDYFDRSARFLFGDRIGGPTADKIMDALRAAGDAGMARAEIRREVFHDNVKAHEITRALGMLRSFRMARSESIPRNERTEERWFYVRT